VVATVSEPPFRCRVETLSWLKLASVSTAQKMFDDAGEQVRAAAYKVFLVEFHVHRVPRAKVMPFSDMIRANCGRLFRSVMPSICFTEYEELVKLYSFRISEGSRPPPPATGNSATVRNQPPQRGFPGGRPQGRRGFPQRHDGVDRRSALQFEIARLHPNGRRAEIPVGAREPHREAVDVRRHRPLLQVDQRENISVPSSSRRPEARAKPSKRPARGRPVAVAKGIERLEANRSCESGRTLTTSSTEKISVRWAGGCRHDG